MRGAIFRMHVGEAGLADDVMYQFSGAQTEGCSGRHIHRVCKGATEAMIREDGPMTAAADLARYEAFRTQRGS